MEAREDEFKINKIKLGKFKESFTRIREDNSKKVQTLDMEALEYQREMCFVNSSSMKNNA